MFYYLYQITNNLNGKIYIGVHKTASLDDGYMGSGKVIKRAIEKHGIENFTKVILETFENAEAMYAREAEVVTDAFLLREDVYNLRRGGYGGFDHINKEGLNVYGTNGNNHIYLPNVNGTSVKDVLIRNGTWENYRLKMSQTMIKRIKQHGSTWEGKSHKEETKKKIGLANSIKQSGPKNSQYGTMWITNEVENKKIGKDETIPDGWRKGRIIRQLVNRTLVSEKVNAVPVVMTH